MILDDGLVAPRDEHEVLDAGRAGLVDDVLDDRPVDDRQHLLGDGLRRGQKPRAESGHGKHGFADTLSSIATWGLQMGRAYGRCATLARVFDGHFAV